jgi:hypothetical protein
MRSKIYMIGLVALLLLATSDQTGVTYCRVVRSARDFQERFRQLDSSRTSLNPVERFVFSLMLTGSEAPRPQAGAAVAHRAS